MNAFCYIIFSPKLNKFYIGASQEDFVTRLDKHNNHTYGVDRFTSKSNDWEKFIVIPAKDYAHAIRIERAIKSKKSSIFIRNLKKYTELKQKIIDQTST